jgi:hypothetical protein
MSCASSSLSLLLLRFLQSPLFFGCRINADMRWVYCRLDLTLPLNGSIDTTIPAWGTNVLDQVRCNLCLFCLPRALSSYFILPPRFLSIFSSFYYISNPKLST